MTAEIQNIEVEQALLGAVLINNDVMARAGGIVRDADFADPVHAEIWAACASRIAADQLASPTTLALAFEGHPGLAQLGGPAYLVRLAGAAVSIFAAKDYAQIVARCARKRRLAETLAAAAARLHDDDADVDVALGMVEAQSLAEETQPGASAVVPFRQALAAAVAAANEADLRDGVVGVTSGIDDLDAETGGFMAGELIILAGRPAMGKAQPLTSPVLLADGTWRAIGALRFGDALASIDGEPSRVLAVHDRGELPSFTVTFSDGRSTRVAGDHLWRVRSRHWREPRVIDTNELSRLITKSRHQNRLSIDLVSGHFGSDEDVSADPYLCGVVLGDGSTLNSGIRLTCADDEILREVSARLPEGMVCQRVSGSYAYSLRRRVIDGKSNNPLASALRDLGMMGVRGECKRVPQAFMRASRDVRIEVLRGLMDTDGWAEKLGAVRFVSTSLGLAQDVAYLVRSLGGLASIRAKVPSCTLPSGRKVEGRPAFTVKIRHPNPEALFHLPRKAGRCRRERNVSVRLTVSSVVPCGSERMRCITVSHPSSLYVTDDFIVTHNSAVALSMALAAARAGHGVAICSLEMTPAEIGIRALSSEAARHGAGFAYRDARRGSLPEGGVQRIVETARAIEALPIEFTPPSYRDIASIHAAVRRIQSRYEAEGGSLGLVVIDYLQLIQPSTQRRGGSRQEDVAEISAALKGMAMRLNVPVLALSQLSRAVESRDDKRPVLGDLRESGAIEQDANTVIMVFREEYYLRREEPHPHESADEHADWHAALQRCAGLVDLIVSKQRMGDTPTIRARFDAPTNTIADLGRPL